MIACATAVKLFATGPAKANKAEKVEIMKQLLALSEGENRIPAKPTAAQARPPQPKPVTRRSNSPRPATVKISQPIRSSK